MSVVPLSLDFRLVPVHKPLFFCGVSPTDGDLRRRNGDGSV